MIISPLLLSYSLSQIALQKAVHSINDELFTYGGAEIFINDFSDYNLKNEITFKEIGIELEYYDEIALGFQIENDEKNRGIYLNPENEKTFHLSNGF